MSNQSQWKNASELPDSGLTVLVHTPAEVYPVWLGYHDGQSWRDVEGHEVTVTHWMNLPQPP